MNGLLRAELLKQRPSTGVTVSQAPSGSAVQDEDQQLLNFVQQSSRTRAACKVC